MHARDIYIEVTDKTGNSVIQERRVWDADKFLASVRDQYAKENGIIAVSTKEAYMAQRSSK